MGVCACKTTRRTVENGGKTTRRAAACKDNTGVGVDGFYPNVPLDSSDALCEEIVTVFFLQESGNGWSMAQEPAHAFLLDPKKVTSPRPIPLLSCGKDGGRGQERQLSRNGTASQR